MGTCLNLSQYKTSPFCILCIPGAMAIPAPFESADSRPGRIRCLFFPFLLIDKIIGQSNTTECKNVV